MRRIALSLSIVASLALLDACTGGSQGTGFSNTDSTSASIDGINFMTAGTGTVSNVFIVSGTAVATPTPTPPPTPSPTPAGATPTPTAPPTGTTPAPTPTAPPTGPTPPPTASPTAPPPTPAPTPTPPFTIPTPIPPSPGLGAPPNQPLLIEAVGFKRGGGVLGYVSVPSTSFRWSAFYAPTGTIVNNRTDGSTIKCGAAPTVPGSGNPINIDYQFAPTTSNPVPANGDTVDSKHSGFAIASLDSTLTTVNFYNTIAFFAPQIKTSQYCITLLATASNGVHGTATVVVNL